MGIILLRPTQTTDLDFVCQAERDPANCAFILQWSRAEHTAALSDPNVTHQIIERSADAVPVGYTILAGLTNPNRCLELKRLVVTEKGQGYGKQALRHLQQQAFEQYHAHRLQLDVKTFNQRAYGLYRKVGLVEEGRLRDCILTETGFESLVIMSILASEYEEMKKLG
ncbi:MAG: GNAT family N-acetyltransferase [Spirulinaceae cyanobacterium]